MDVMRLSKKYKIEAMGVLNFCTEHNVQPENSPVCIMPTTAHISLFKGTNLAGMGLGELQTILIPCDENSRMKTDGEFDFIVFSKRKNNLYLFKLAALSLFSASNYLGNTLK